MIRPNPTTPAPVARPRKQARKARGDAAGRPASAPQPVAAAAYTTRSVRPRPQPSPRGFLPRSESTEAPGLDLTDIRRLSASTRRAPPEAPASARTRITAAAAVECREGLPHRPRQAGIAAN